MALSPTRVITTGPETLTRSIPAGLRTISVLSGSRKKGATIAMNDSTLAYYGTTIKLYDHNERCKN